MDSIDKEQIQKELQISVENNDCNKIKHLYAKYGNKISFVSSMFLLWDKQIKYGLDMPLGDSQYSLVKAIIYDINIPIETWFLQYFSIIMKLPDIKFLYETNRVTTQKINIIACSLRDKSEDFIEYLVDKGVDVSRFKWNYQYTYTNFQKRMIEKSNNREMKFRVAQVLTTRKHELMAAKDMLETIMGFIVDSPHINVIGNKSYNSILQSKQYK